MKVLSYSVTLSLFYQPSYEVRREQVVGDYGGNFGNVNVKHSLALLKEDWGRGCLGAISVS